MQAGEVSPALALSPDLSMSHQSKQENLVLPLARDGDMN